MTPTKPLVLVLALSALIFGALLPPEAYPAGKMGMVLCSTFAFLIAMTERRIPRGYLLSGLVVFLVLILHSLFISVDRYRSLEFLTVLWAYYCLLGFFVYASFDSLTYFAGVAVILAIVVSVYGIYQYFWGFAEMREYIVYSVSGQARKGLALGIIANKRVFSTLALPGTLWGFLLVLLPTHAFLWKRHPLLDLTLVLSATLLLAAGFLTRSFGFVVGLSVLILGYLTVGAVYDRPGAHRAPLQKALLALAILIAASGIFYAARRGVIQEANPVTLRFKTWVSAWSIFALNPLGTGLNTYGVMYPQHMQSGAIETQHAHNTALQLMSELGYPAVFAGILAIVLLAGRTRINLRDSRTFFLVLALLVWLVHNIVDINVYFPSIGILGVILIGILFSRPQVRIPDIPKALLAAITLITVAVVVFSGVNLVSGELEHRAQIEYENSKPLAALATLEMVKKLNPLNSTPFEDSGEILLDLYYKQKDPEYLVRATQAFRRAIELSPLKADPHIWFALCLSSADKMDSAFDEIYRARELYPSSDRIQAIIRLMEKRQETP